MAIPTEADTLEAARLIKELTKTLNDAILHASYQMLKVEMTIIEQHSSRGTFPHLSPTVMKVL